MKKIPKKYGVIIALTEEMRDYLSERYRDFIHDEQQLEKILTRLALRSVNIPEEYWYKVRVKVFERVNYGIICIRLTSNKQLSLDLPLVLEGAEYPQRTMGL